MMPVSRLADLPRGEALRVESGPPPGSVRGDPHLAALVAVFHTEGGEVYAIDDTCTHQDASLADGWLEDCEVECLLHASKFDLRTGSVDAPPARLPVRTHEVLIDDGVIHVRLSEAPPNLPPSCTAARLAGGAAAGGAA
ncbi:bifunctional 3-phenylpropionate/cinnamic acid dioxygenase ferredoxin subunit [Streptomyces sp. NPDC017958]|uniref:bifunctional 3-phenylpropionate/cinnamic acid dioxygenase ferredoxin subunit n=1 Tax=Streptomyces sp. NPDC017958 TaxID=3365021 RepID=UPI0037BD2274